MVAERKPALTPALSHRSCFSPHDPHPAFGHLLPLHWAKDFGEREKLFPRVGDVTAPDWRWFRGSVDEFLREISPYPLKPEDGGGREEARPHPSLPQEKESLFPRWLGSESVVGVRLLRAGTRGRSGEKWVIGIWGCCPVRRGDSTVPPGRKHSVGDLTRRWRAWLISGVAPRLDTMPPPTNGWGK
jgi:hypothetical protein